MKAKNKKRVAVGIDLGTTFSVVAYVDENGTPRVLRNADGKPTTPSVVCFKDGEVLVGDEAKEEQATGALDVASFFKRHMGDSTFAFSTSDGRTYSAEELSTFVLRKLKEDAEVELGQEITDAVVTVPAYFDNFQRLATLNAAKTAGLNVSRILNEPTAAALAYGVKSNGTDERYLVYDLGGGTFDVSVIETNEREVRVLATDGDHRLGGKDWDDRVLQYVATQFADETGLDLYDDVESCNEALVAAERAKLELSRRAQTTISVAKDGEKRSYLLTREKLEELTVDLFERTATLCNDVLAACSPSLKWSDLTGALLVGGSTRLLAVQGFIERLTGKPALTGVNVDEAVALGAALQAVADLEEELESGGYELETTRRRSNANALTRRKLEDVASRSLGLIAENDDRSRYVNSVVIPKNSPIPAENVKRHKLRIGNSALAKLEVYLLQGDEPTPLDCLILGKYDFTEFDAEASGEALIDVAYRYDRNGVVDVTATQVSTGKALKKSVQPIPDDMSWAAKAPKDLTPRRVVEPLSIVFAVDVSGSMCGTPTKKACAAFEEFIGKFNMQTTQIAVVAFADRTKKVCDLTNLPSKLTSAVDKIRSYSLNCGVGTSAIPFQKALEMLQSQTGKRFIVALTDGQWYDETKAVKHAQKCKDAGIEIVAIGFGDADKAFLKKIASSDENALFSNLSRLVEDFSTIAQTIRKSSELTL